MSEREYTTPGVSGHGKEWTADTPTRVYPSKERYWEIDGVETKWSGYENAVGWHNRELATGKTWISTDKWNDNPAFERESAQPQPALTVPSALGMTLRDAFAIAAIAVEGGFACRNHESIATECYRLADAMLAERERS